MSNQIHVRRIAVEEVQIARAFLFKMVKKLLNTYEKPLYHHDIINLKETYIDNKKNTLVGAFNESGELIGTIAVKQFVDRFPCYTELLSGRKFATVRLL